MESYANQISLFLQVWMSLVCPLPWLELPVVVDTSGCLRALLLILEENFVSLWCLLWVFHIVAVSLYSSSVECFYHETLCCILVCFFYISWDDPVFFLHLVGVAYYTDLVPMTCYAAEFRSLTFCWGLCPSAHESYWPTVFVSRSVSGAFDTWVICRIHSMN